MFRGKKYVEFLKTDKKSQSMNTYIEEFKVLAQSKAGIKNFIDTIALIKCNDEVAEIETPSEGSVSMHKWGYFDVHSGELIKEGDKWHFDVDKCNEDGKAEASVDLISNMLAPKFFTFSSTFEVPQEDLLVKPAFIYVMKQYVERRRDGDCFACCQNIPLTNSLHDDGRLLHVMEIILWKSIFPLSFYRSPKKMLNRFVATLWPN